MTRSLAPTAPDPRAAAALLRGGVRVLGRALVRAAYRFRVQGLGNLPAGPALLLPNHVAFVDWLYLGAALPRLPRFVMHQHHWRMSRFRWFFELHGVIPIAPRSEDPSRLRDAVRAIDRALEAGDHVLLFPEGTMTPDGELSPLRPGFTRILRRRPVPVVPIGIRGAWGSWFSRAGGPPMRKLPRRLRAPLEVRVGAPLPPEEATVEAVEARLRALRGPVPEGLSSPRGSGRRRRSIQGPTG